MKTSRWTRFKKISAATAVIAGLATTVMPSSASARLNPEAGKNADLVIVHGEAGVPFCTQDSPGIVGVSIWKSMMETLTTLNSKNQVVNLLAQSVTPVTAGDYTNWKIEVRPGIKFSNGEELTAEHVILNLTAAIGALPTIKPSLPAAFWSTMIDVVALKTGKTMTVDPTNKYATTVKLTRAYKNFPYALYFEGRMVMRAKAMLLNPKGECGTGINNPSGVIGTGPFKYSSHTATDFNLIRNDTYWRKDAAGKILPYAKSLTWRVVESAAQRSIALRTGTANIGWYGAAEAGNFKKLEGNSKLNLTKSAPENQAAFILNTGYMLNASKAVVGKSPFNSLNARLAFAYAINQKKLAALGKGYYQIPTSLAPNGNVAYTTKGFIKSNRAKAAQYAAAYKAETGKDLEFTFTHAQTADSIQQAQIVCAQVNLVAGMKCTPVNGGTSTQVISAGFAGMTNIVAYTFISGKWFDFATLFSTTGNLEISQLRNGTEDQKAILETTARARETNDAKGYQKVVRFYQENAVWVPAYNYSYMMAAAKNVSGIGKTPLPEGGLPQVIGSSGIDVASVKVG